VIDTDPAGDPAANPATYPLPALGANYYKLWSASAISNLGDGIGVVAWPWLASLLTRDPMAIAMVAIAQRLPWLVISLPAGILTDRFDRRKLVLWMDVARTLLFAAVAAAVFSHAPFPNEIGKIVDAPGLYGWMLACALAVGMAEVLRDNAAQTLMPAIVPPQRLEAANGRLWSVEVLMNSMVGPPLAGLVIAIALPVAFAINAVTFAVSAALILTLRGNFVPKVQTGGHWLDQMKEGIRYLNRNLLLRDLAHALGVFNASYQMLLVAMVLFAQETLQLSSIQYGLLLTSLAAGGILGGIFAEPIANRLGKGLCLRLALIVAVMQFAVIAVTDSAILVWVVLFAGEVIAMVWNSITVSLRQRLIADELLGRVNSVYRFFGWGLMPIGIIVGGAVVAFTETITTRDIALRTPFALGAVILLVLVIVYWKRFSDAALENAAFA